MKRLLFLLIIFLQISIAQPPLRTLVRVVSTRTGLIGYREATQQHRGLPRCNGKIFGTLVTPQHETSKT